MNSGGSRRGRIGLVVVALVLGGVMGLLSLWAGPPGLVAAALIAALLLVARPERWTAGAYLVGGGAVGAWLLSPTVTNTDPAVRYSLATGVVPFIVYLLIAGAGIVLLLTGVIRRPSRG